MIRMGPQSGRARDGHSRKAGEELEDSEAAGLAADWADISQGLKKDLGQQLHAQWIKPIRLGQFCEDSGVLELFLPTQFLADWVQNHYLDRLGLAEYFAMEAYVVA